MPRQARHTLTALKLKHLLSNSSRWPVAVSDGAGLTLTVSSTGYAAWVLRYRYGGKRREFSIGAYKDFPLAEARDRASELRRMIAGGVDPRRAKAARLAAESTPEPGTFRALAATWYARKVEQSHKHPERTRSLIDKRINPKLGKLHPHDITAAHVAELVEGIIHSGAPTTANDVRRVVRAILDYGVALGWIPSNPAAGVTQSIAGAVERPRSRVLSLDEIKTLLGLCVEHRDRFGRDNELAVRLLLLLGVRKGELVGAKWSEFDLDGSLWLIPPERTKTKRGFTVPLPGLAVGWLQELEVRACEAEWVFPARRRGRRKLGHISPDTLNAALLHSLPSGQIEPFTIHDLRRTMRSHLAALGVRVEVAERCLNHSLRGVVETYDRHDYLEQRAEALELWASELRALLPEGGATGRLHVVK